jgi:hypothetical protein
MRVQLAEEREGYGSNTCSAAVAEAGASTTQAAAKMRVKMLFIFVGCPPKVKV